MLIREDPCDTGDEFLIKVCGIVRLEEALLSIDYGANAVGFNFYPESPRYIEPEHAKKIIEKIPSGVLTVAVIVAHSQGEIGGEDFPVDAFQLHAIRDESEIPLTGKRVFIATSPSEASRFPNHEILIDTSWGTGKQADWGEVIKLRRPFILSGGLTPENVAEAIELMCPAGIDVCSGVERAPGVKDAVKLERFMESVREAVNRP